MSSYFIFKIPLLLHTVLSSAQFSKCTNTVFNFSLEILIATQEGDKSFQLNHFFIFPPPEVIRTQNCTYVFPMVGS